MTTAVKKKPYVKGLRVTLGLLSTVGDVLNVKKPNAGAEAKSKYACPLHPDTPHGVEQRYICSENPDEEPFTPGECLKGKETPDGFVILNQEELAKARLSALPAKTLELRAHPYASDETFASGGAYIFQPESADDFYSTLLLLVDEKGVVETESGPQMIVGLVALRSNSEAFVRVERWGDQLVLRELIRPEDLDTFEPLEVSVESKMLDMAKMLLDAQSEEFDPETYKSAIRERIAQLSVLELGAEAPVVSSRQEKQDTFALLEASIAAAKAKKATA